MKWIDIQEVQPEENAILYANDRVIIGTVTRIEDSYLGQSVCDVMVNVTHWIPIPEFPEK